MLKNENSSKVHEIGDCTQSHNLNNASLRKFTNDDCKDLKLSKLICN